MRTRKSSKAALFLIELIIAIVFFALASAICVQLFAHAHTLSTQSRDLSLAVNMAQNTAETFKASPNPAELYGGASSGAWTVYYDREGIKRDEERAIFQIRVDYDLETRPASAAISVLRLGDEEPLFSLVAKKQMLQESVEP